MRVVTGPMGSGKTTVLQILKDKGFSVLRADDLAKNFMDEDFFQRMKERFPFVSSREQFSTEFFQRRDLKLWVEREIHPKVYGELRHSSVDFAEIPLYFESWEIAREAGFIPHSVVYVTLDKALRMERLKKYRAMGEEEISLREQYFMKEERKMRLSDYILYNDGSLETLKERVEEYLRCENLDL
ncbi:MAG: dephospho-CoA kinase [Tissierellia bacterium]|nr:dephospho-CoA kinase [Tissierellia bacterium]